MQILMKRILDDKNWSKTILSYLISCFKLVRTESVHLINSNSSRQKGYRHHHVRNCVYKFHFFYVFFVIYLGLFELSEVLLL